MVKVIEGNDISECVEVPVSWLEGLYRQMEEFDREENPKSLRACALIGYISSAQIILNHKKVWQPNNKY